MAQPQQMLKFSVHHYRAPGVDEQAFAKWYQEEQIPRMIGLLHKHGINHYKLYISPESLRQLFQPDLAKMKPNDPGWKMADYDATATYYLDDPQKLRNLHADPEWQTNHVEPEQDWVDAARGEVQIGWETVYIEDNKIVNVVPKV